MLIGYRNNKLQKHCQEPRKKWGTKIGKQVAKRLGELNAFEKLSDVPHLPPHYLHMLEGKKKQFSIRITENYRMVFSPAEPYKIEKNEIDRTTVKAITIEFIGDYH